VDTAAGGFFEQSISSFKKRWAAGELRVLARWFGRLKASPAMLANNQLAQILDTHLEVSSASVALLHEVSLQSHVQPPAERKIRVKRQWHYDTIVQTESNARNRIFFLGSSHLLPQLPIPGGVASLVWRDFGLTELLRLSGRTGELPRISAFFWTDTNV
jgi:hypothetical protein